MSNVVIFTDGAARGNPGPAAIGAVIKNDEGHLLATISRCIGNATNNQAEYQALIAGLEKAIVLGARQVTVYSDSELLVNQINGRYKIKNTMLRGLYQEAVRWAGRLEKFEMIPIPRERNAAADALANQALDRR